MVKPSTLLILDEPTNHLDIPTKEMLEVWVSHTRILFFTVTMTQCCIKFLYDVAYLWSQEAICEYQGTVITVSHDRYFIKQIVNRVIEVKDKTIQDYTGDYNVSLALFSHTHTHTHISTMGSDEIFLFLIIFKC